MHLLTTSETQQIENIIPGVTSFSSLFFDSASFVLKDLIFFLVILLLSIWSSLGYFAL